MVRRFSHLKHIIADYLKVIVVIVRLKAGDLSLK